MTRIQGKKHKMGTYEINKISLSVFDDRRFVLNDACLFPITDKKDFHKKRRFSQMITDKNKCVQINSRQTG